MYPELMHPVRWRRGHGHTLSANADWMPDFDLMGLHAIRPKADYDTYKV